MAKKKSKVSKTQVIKDYLAAHPDAGPKEVAAAVNKQGLGITTNYVSNVKSKMKGKGKGKKKVAAKKTVAAKQQAASDQISLSALLQAKKLVAKLGGVDQAKEAISALAQLTD
ncbi:MAG: hypothetical protein H8E44_20930 [Planctomycetes bacterium]|nr:hypothetical protein [Planctomycetota bacterium]MBL7043215.1 hypothetical protein [Pirellulaceae bacterium]